MLVKSEANLGPPKRLKGPGGSPPVREDNIGLEGPIAWFVMIRQFDIRTSNV